MKIKQILQHIQHITTEHSTLFSSQSITDHSNWTPLQEAETLLVPFVVSLMNLVIPLLYSLFNKFEFYSSQRKQIYVLLVR